MGKVIHITKKHGFLEYAIHKLFKCPTFWNIKPAFTCPLCRSTYRCYWDGNDVNGHINVCNDCAPRESALEHDEFHAIDNLGV